MKFGDVVKSYFEMDNLPLVAGKLEVPGPEDGNNGIAVKSLKMDSLLDPHNPTENLQKNLQSVKKLNHPPAPPAPCAPVDFGDNISRDIRGVGIDSRPSNNEKPDRKDIVDQSIRPKVIPTSIVKKVNRGKSVKVDENMVKDESCVSPVVKNPRKSVSKREILGSKNASQCHLYVSNKNYIKSTVSDDVIYKGKLSTKMKPNKQKISPETPEKSEIFRMFEKLRKKKEQSVTQEPQVVSLSIDEPKMKSQSKSDNLPGDSVKEHYRLSSQCEKGTTFENSPKLKPKNRSKFEEIRSFFEDKMPENNAIAAHIKHSSNKDSKVTDQNRILNREFLKKNPDINSRDNIEIINAKSEIKSPKKSPIETPENREYFDEVSRVNNRISSVVRSPVPRKSRSPQMDFKKEKTSQRKKLEGNIKKTDNLKSQPPISKFFGLKDIDKK